MNLLSGTSAPPRHAPEASARSTVSALRWPRRNSILTVLIFAWLTMCIVAFEQDRTISSQQELIRSLFRDSLELNAMKMHALRSDQQRPASQPSTAPQR